jgi:putative tricarboxylic transport membrane protein
MRKPTMSRLTMTAATVAVLALVVTGCGPGSASASGQPSRTEAVVHTGPGGGSDVFAREVIKLMQQNKVISSNWPVRNVTEGSGIGAMSYVIGKRGHNDTIAAITPTWLVTPLTLKGSAVSISDLQPIAGLLVEPQVMAVRADSPYHTARDFTNAAKQNSNLVQVGGSVTATDSLTGKALQAQAGAKWKFLSFSDSGQRIASLLRGDAQMMIGSTGDFSEQVRAGKLRVVAVVGAQPLSTFPQVTTLKQQGFQVDQLPEEFRGFVGPQGMPADALTYYQNVLGKLVKTKAWQDYAKQNGDITQFMNAADFGKFLSTQNTAMTALVKQLNLGNQ